MVVELAMGYGHILALLTIMSEAVCMQLFKLNSAKLYGFIRDQRAGYLGEV